MDTLTFAQLLRISYVIPVLLFLSILVVAMALEKFWTLWLTQRLPFGAWGRVKIRIDKGDMPGAMEAAKRMGGALGEGMEKLLNLPNPTTERLLSSFEVYRHRIQMELSRRLGFFGTVSFISPLIGLLGTVLGIVRAFHDLSRQGAGGPAVVAAGISEALLATAAGIGVAVMSAILYNYFTMTVRHRMNVVDLWVLELAELLGQDSAPQP